MISSILMKVRNDYLMHYRHLRVMYYELLMNNKFKCTSQIRYGSR